MTKSADAFRTISEVAEDLDLPQHVLRFWETRFPQIKPLKRAGGRRFYRPADVMLLVRIRELLYGQGYTIKGVQRLLKEQGSRAVSGGDTVARALPLATPSPGVPPLSERHPIDVAQAKAGSAVKNLDANGVNAEAVDNPDGEGLNAVLDIILACQDILGKAKVPL